MSKLKRKLLNSLGEVGKILFLLVIFSLVISILYARFVRKRINFEGTVVDKWTNIAETQQGSFFSPIIVVKTDTGAIVNINVSDENYGRARKGDRITRSSDEIIKIEPQFEIKK